MSVTIAVLHAHGLATGAPDPRDRQVLRRVLDLASAASVTVVVAEPQLGPQQYEELSLAGVEVVEACGRVGSWLRAHGANFDAVVATSIALAVAVQRGAPQVRLVIELDRLESTAAEQSATYHDRLEQPGLAEYLEHLRIQERSVLDHAELVVTTAADLANEVAALTSDATVMTIAPNVGALTAGSERTAPRSDAEGGEVAVIGSFASDRDLPTERLLEALLAFATEADTGPDTETNNAAIGELNNAPTLLAVGVDVSIRRRLLASQATPWGPDDLGTIAPRLRCAIIANRSGSSTMAAELSGLGVPVVRVDMVDAEAIAAAIGAAAELANVVPWQAAHRSALEHVRTHHDPDALRLSLLQAFTSIGVALSVDRHSMRSQALVGSTPSYRRRSVGGTLAAQSAASERFRSEAQPWPLLKWQHSLYANLDLEPDLAWRRYVAVHHDAKPRLAVLRARSARLSVRPRFSVVMPIHDADPDALSAAVSSIRGQIYPEWELRIVNDGSRSEATVKALSGAIAGDQRIDVVTHDQAQGISAATNRAIAGATGDFVAFVDHDDVVSADALYWVARAIELNPQLDVIYSDEDKLTEQGERAEPFCKPDWSPDLLLSCNYITHFLVVRRTVVQQVGGLRSDFDGAQDYDLLLRLAEITDSFCHIPKPLYSWRKSPTSTAADIDAKPASHRASRAALDDAIKRRGIDGWRTPGIDPTWHRVHYRPRHEATITVIIPTRDRLDLLEPCIELVRAAADPDHTEILVLDNESTDHATLSYLNAFEGPNTRVVRYPHRFNYARQMNLAALHAKGELLLMLNNDARPVGTDWIDAMVEHAMRPEVGAVGARLRFPDGRAQHEGVVLNAGGVALNLDAGSHAVLSENIRNVAAVTGACLMVRRSVWEDVRGMDERLRVAYNDVDLCLRIGERGLRIIYTPLAELVHNESSSRGSLHPEVDEASYQSRWGPPQTCADPFFTTSLELMQPFVPRL